MKNHNVNRAIEAAIADEDWPGARAHILADLKKTPQDHWLLARLSTTHYEERQYAKALEIIEQALRLQPSCPLALWDYAGTLSAVGRPREALKVYNRLIKKGPRAIGDMKPCGEGTEWALSLLTDCIYRSGVCWEQLGKTDRALRWYHAFIQLRTEWTGGIHTAEDARRRIERLSRNNPRRTNSEFGKIRDRLLGSAS
jgi:tetratricopeptide (TPR) repeat protein